jgi:hypothetical protein
MPNIKLLAEKYSEVQTQNIESLIADVSATELLECFSELARVDEENVLISFNHAIKARQSGVEMVKESTRFEDQDLKLAILALEKVLSHFDSTQDEGYCVMFEAFVSGKKKKIEDEDVNPQGDPNNVNKPGFLNKLGQGIKKYAGKAATAIGNGLKAAPGAIAKGAAATGKYVGQTVGGAVGGLAGGLVGGTSAYANARDTAPYAGGTQGANKTGTAPAADTAPAAPTAGTSPTAGTAPAVPAASDAQAKVGVGQINKIVGTLRARDLESIKKNIEQRLAALTAKRAPKDGTVTQNVTPGAGTQTPATPAAAESVIKEYYIINNKHFRK